MSSIAESYNKKGAQLYRDQLYTEATITFSKGLELEPENVTILCNRSAAYEATNKPNDALKDAELAIQLNPKYIKAYYRKSKALFLKLEHKYSKNNDNGHDYDFKSVWEEILRCIDIGLEIDPEYKELVDYKDFILNHALYLSCFRKDDKNNDDGNNKVSQQSDVSNTNTDTGDISKEKQKENVEKNGETTKQNENDNEEAKPLLIDNPESTGDSEKITINDNTNTNKMDKNIDIKIGDQTQFRRKTSTEIQIPSPRQSTSIDFSEDEFSDIEETIFPKYVENSDDESVLQSNNIQHINSNTMVGAPIMTSFVPIESNGLPKPRVHSIVNKASAIQKTLSTPYSSGPNISTAFVSQPSTLSQTTSSPIPIVPTNPTPIISSNSSIVTSFTPSAASHILSKSDNAISRSYSSPITLDSNTLSPQKTKRESIFTTSPPGASFAKYVKPKTFEFMDDEKSFSSPSPPSSPSKFYEFKTEKNSLSPTVSPPLTPAQPNQVVTSSSSSSSTSSTSTLKEKESTSSGSTSSASSLSASIMEPIAKVAKMFSQFSSSKDKDKKKEEQKETESNKSQNKENPTVLPDIDLIEFGLSKSDPIETPESDPNVDKLPLIDDIDPVISDEGEFEFPPKIEIEITAEKQENKDSKINYFQNSTDSLSNGSDQLTNTNNINVTNKELTELSDKVKSLSTTTSPVFGNERPHSFKNSSPDVFLYIQNDNAFNSKGVEFFKNRKYSEAINCFNKAIDINPHNYYYFINRAAARLSNGDPHSALEDIEYSIRLYPRDPTAYARKAEIYFFMNSPKLAKQTLEEGMHNLTLSEKEKQDFEKAIKFAESKSSYIKDISIRFISSNTDQPQIPDSFFSPPTSELANSKSKLEISNFIKPAPVFRNNLLDSVKASELHSQSEPITIDITHNDIQLSPKRNFPIRSPESADNLLSPSKQSLSPRAILRRSSSNSALTQIVDQRRLELVDQDGNQLTALQNEYLFNEIHRNRLWYFINSQLQSGKISFFPTSGKEVPIILLPLNSVLPADPTPLDEYYESHFATITSVCRPGNASPLSGEISKSQEELITADCVQSVIDENLSSDLHKNWPEKFTFKTLNHIEGIIEKNKITILMNPFERMLGTEGQDFSMNGPVSIDIIAEGYVSFIHPFKAPFREENSQNAPIIKLFIIGTSIFPCEIEKIFTNFILLEAEIKEKMQKKDTAAALLEIYWKKYQDDRAANLRANIDKFANEFRKKPPSTLEEKASTFKNFISTILEELKENELWESAPKEEIDCAIFNLRKQVLSQLTDLLRNEDREEDEKLKKLIKRLYFVTAEHLGLPEFDINDSVYATAKAEMAAIDDFTSPREKLECLLHCCKILNYQITTMGKIANADELLPRLILLILHTNPPQLPSNLKFIQLFCDREDNTLAEAFYYVTMVESAVYFIQNISSKFLNIPEEDFDRLMKESEQNEEPKDENPQTPEEKSIDGKLAINFFNKDSQQINTSDLPQLLSEYKKLASVLQSIRPDLIQINAP